MARRLGLTFVCRRSGHVERRADLPEPGRVKSLLLRSGRAMYLHELHWLRWPDRAFLHPSRRHTDPCACQLRRSHAPVLRADQPNIYIPTMKAVQILIVSKRVPSASVPANDVIVRGWGVEADYRWRRYVHVLHKVPCHVAGWWTRAACVSASWRADGLDCSNAGRGWTAVCGREVRGRGRPTHSQRVDGWKPRSTDTPPPRPETLRSDTDELAPR